MTEKPPVNSKVMTPKLHAIQLVAIQTTELHIKVMGDPSLLESFEGCATTLEASHSAYDEAEQTIQIRVRASVSESESVPLSLSVEIVGLYNVDESQFDKRLVQDWAKINAPYTLYPYVREHVFSLATRVGVKGLLMPLLEIPTFKVISPE